MRTNIKYNFNLELLQPLCNIIDKLYHLKIKQQQQQNMLKTTQAPKAVDDGLSTDARIKSFAAELNEFRENFNKLFNGKDLAKCLLNLSVIKDTKSAEEIIKKISEEMKVSCVYCVFKKKIKNLIIIKVKVITRIS